MQDHSTAKMKSFCHQQSAVYVLEEASNQSTSLKPSSHSINANLLTKRCAVYRVLFLWHSALAHHSRDQSLLSHTNHMPEEGPRYQKAFPYISMETGCLSPRPVHWPACWLTNHNRLCETTIRFAISETFVVGLLFIRHCSLYVCYFILFYFFGVVVGGGSEEYTPNHNKLFLLPCFC